MIAIAFCSNRRRVVTHRAVVRDDEAIEASLKNFFYDSCL